MAQLSDIEMARRRLAKVARAGIRLRYSVAADEEINAQLPALLARFDASISNGELPAAALSLVMSDATVSEDAD